MASNIYTTRIISHAEAREIAQRLINSHFRQEPGARVGIPARPDYDDDLLICAYIEQREKEATAIEDSRADVDLMERVAKAIEAGDGEFGFNIRLVRLVDGEETWSLSTTDGEPDVEFSDRDGAYRLLSERKARFKVGTALAAFRPGDKIGGGLVAEQQKPRTPCCFDIPGSDRVRGKDEACRVCPERAMLAAAKETGR